MTADQGAPGTPEQPVTPPAEEETLNVSEEEVQPAAPSAPLPPADPAPHHDDLEVTLVTPPPAAPAAAGWPAPETPPQPPAPVAPMEVTMPPGPVVQPPAPVPPAPAPAAPAPAPPVGVAPAPAPRVVVGGDSQWYTTVAGKTYGPYSAGELHHWLQTGQVTWDTLAARAGEDSWRPLHQIVEFNPSPGYGAPIGVALTAGKKDKTVAGILGILLGGVGAHHWYLGNYTYAAIYLVVGLFTAFTLPWIAGIVEGIMYLTATEERFQEKYKNLFMSG
jgi:TM2 domain-containing membrane protein YozV